VYVYFHIRAVKTQQTVCQIVSQCNIQHYVIYSYMFRPCKRAIIRLFLEPVIGLYNRSMGGRDLVLRHILWGYMVVNIYIDVWLPNEKFFILILNLNLCVNTEWTQKSIHSLLINIFCINLHEISTYVVP
jgi:hypothetical protein